MACGLVKCLVVCKQGTHPLFFQPMSAFAKPPPPPSVTNIICEQPLNKKNDNTKYIVHNSSSQPPSSGPAPPRTPPADSCWPCPCLFPSLLRVNLHRKELIQVRGHFLAALSSSRSLVVGPSVRPSVGPSVGHVCEKVTFRVLEGN